MEQELIKKLLTDPSVGLIVLFAFVHFGPKIYIFTQRKMQGHNGSATQLGAIDKSASMLTNFIADFKDFRKESADRDEKIIEKQNAQNADIEVLKFHTRKMDERIKGIETHMEHCPVRRMKG